jgi:predicted nucleotidyltransferase
MQRRSSNSAGAVYLDREARIRELEQMARRAAARLPEIRRILLFGSLVSGIPTPRSDADLLVEVSNSAQENPRERTSEVLRVMSPLVCPIDLYVYTTSELNELAAAGSPLVAAALRDGRNLLR